MKNWPPVIGIWGRSGSGKTFLIEQLLLGFLRHERLRVAVVKRCSHKMTVDRPGKDSDRMFVAGADIFAHNPSQAFIRIHTDEMPLSDCLQRLGCGYDLVLVEGHRESPIPKVWLLQQDETGRPDDAQEVMEVLPWDTDRPGRAAAVIMQYLKRMHATVPTCAAVLIGGNSSRMGRSKTMLNVGGRFLLERIVSAAEAIADEVVLVGNGPLPPPLADMKRLPDARGLNGPLAGILSAMRWRPDARWMVLACDTPFVSVEAFRWLLGQTRSGIWAVLPHLDTAEQREPLLAVYEPPAGDLLERGINAGEQCIQRLLVGENIASPMIPAGIRDAWVNINTPRDWDAALARLKSAMRHEASKPAPA